MADFDAGVHYSPNINNNSEVYEVENIACDPENKIESFFASLIKPADKTILDIGCGTGFHLPHFASVASHIFGIEPYDPSRLQALKRLSDGNYNNISLLKGSAETILLKNESIDFAYSRFAYFWGPGCEPGLEEVFRVLKPGGLFCMIDNNLERGRFGSWVKKSFKFKDDKQDQVDQFWSKNGFKLKTIDSSWAFETRKDLEDVIKIEFPKEISSEIIANHSGTSIDYCFNIYYKFKGNI